MFFRSIIETLCCELLNCNAQFAMARVKYAHGGDPSPNDQLELPMNNVRQKKLEMMDAMNRARALEPSSFVPNKLLDTLIQKMNLKNDAELCRALEVQPPIISKIRHRKLTVGATILLRMHEKSELSIRDLKELSAAPMH